MSNYINIISTTKSNRGLFFKLSIFALFSMMVLFSGQASAQRTALINGSTVSGGASSREAVAATAQGFTVTIVTDAVWDTMTAAQFGTFDMLVIGDPNCGEISQALSNAAVWAPVVMGTAGGRTQAGNRILIGTDPVFHFSQGGSALIPRGITFAGAQSGRTGLYFASSCTGNTAAVLSTLNLLSIGSGAWTANAAPPCGGAASLIASEPSFMGLTSANLQGWGCSVHTAYPTFRSDWNALAVATDTPTQPTCGVDPNTGMSACGQAYILLAGSSIVVVSDSIALSPLTDTNPVNTPHTVTATVTRSGAPLANQVITFTVTGVNPGAMGTCSPAGCITNSSGLVTFTYTGTNIGNDTITASFTDINGSLQSATAQKTWVAAGGTPTPTPTPTATPTPTPGSGCTPTTTVTEGDLAPGGIASFNVTSGPGSVTVDHVNAGTGLRTLTVVGTPTNATVNIPAFTPGTTMPVVVTFTATNTDQPVDFTLRAASSFHSAFIRVRCNRSTCTPTSTVTEGDLAPGGIASFNVMTGMNSVTVDHVNAGTGLQSLTVVGTPVNATVNIPPFTPGTQMPVVVTFTPTDPSMAVSFRLRAASTFHAAFIDVRCAVAPPPTGKSDIESMAPPNPSRKRLKK